MESADLPEHETVVGVPQIARRLKRGRSTVDQWRWRTTKVPFPQPRWNVGGCPAWDWALDIEPWAKETGRLPH